MTPSHTLLGDYYIIMKTTLAAVIVSVILVSGVRSSGRKLHQHVFAAHVTSDGSAHDVRVLNEIWLRTVPPFFTVNGHRYEAADGSLKLLSHATRTGKDIHGLWESHDLLYSAGRVKVEVSTRNYFNKSMIIFEQKFPEGANDTSVGGPDFSLSGFPRIIVGGQSPGLELGCLNYGGMFVGDTTKWMDRWTNLTFNFRDGVPGGPIVLFDKRGQAIVISSYNNFMASVFEHEGLLGGVLSYGIMGSVNSIPAGYSTQTIMYYSDKGINEAFSGWGHVLRKQYGRHDNYVKSDFAVNYLGYWTDNGAYYYYLTEKNKTYDKTIYDVQKYANEKGIPYRYVQYDSWWYSMGPLGGVKRWEGRPNIFPQGMVAVYNETRWPVVAHNRWWSSFTPYAKENGGPFTFLMEKFKSVPMDLDFWDWLFKESKKWGLITYEQDWLDAQLLGVEGLLTDVYSARKWLMLMGKAAQMNNINIQYCMSFSRHALQALEIPVVTQIRVSDDYQPGENDWKIAISSIFAHALRIAPYKDTFWTTSVQPGNPYGKSENHPALHALASVLSTGPVGPGDRLGFTNVSLLLRCCNSDGLILKPDKPVTAIDDQIIEAAFRDGSGAKGEVWSTYSVISGWTFGIIVAASMRPEDVYNISATSAGFRDMLPVSKVFVDDPNHPTPARSFDDLHPLTLRGCDDVNFCLFHTTPVITLRDKEVLLYGEITKWVPMSSKRVDTILLTSDDVIIGVSGGVNEIVSFWYSWGGSFIKIKCLLSEFGKATISVKMQKCFRT